MTKKLWEIFVPLKHHLNVHVVNIHGFYWKRQKRLKNEKRQTYYKFNYSKEVKSTQNSHSWNGNIICKRSNFVNNSGFSLLMQNIAINECIKQKSKQTKNPMGSITRRMLQFYMKIQRDFRILKATYIVL